MTLAERLSDFVRACTTGLWIVSHEHQDAITEIARLCHAEGWRLATWDVDGGLSVAGEDVDSGAGDPLAAIRALGSLATEDGTAILVLQNFHRFVSSAEIAQALARRIVAGKQNRAFVVVLAPVVGIPVELEKLFVVLEHELPGREQLAEIARGIGTEEGSRFAAPERRRTPAPDSMATSCGRSDSSTPSRNRTRQGCSRSRGERITTPTAPRGCSNRPPSPSRSRSATT